MWARKIMGSRGFTTSIEAEKDGEGIMMGEVDRFGGQYWGERVTVGSHRVIIC